MKRHLPTDRELRGELFDASLRHPPASVSTATSAAASLGQLASRVGLLEQQMQQFDARLVELDGRTVRAEDIADAGAEW